MFERPKKGRQKAILVQIDFNRQGEALEEFCELANSAGAIIAESIVGARQRPDPKYFIGKGKALEIQRAVCAHQADLVLINHELSPAQERNLEKYLSCRVLDRTGLILDIFAQRARTFEGKLQVELAQLQHLSTRLVRGWGHLESQQGGIGFRGPGETQLEVDRRLIRVRIKTIKKRLERVRKQRHQMRQKRLRMPILSIIGYTNAGKSTLFNALTQEHVYVADQLFATLDPTLRRIELPHFGSAVIADTVGFIRDLPHDLVNAFHATLEETQTANLLLHVVDAHGECRHEQVEQVNEVLRQIKAENVPQLVVFNKIDLLKQVKPRIDTDEQGRPTRVWISATQGKGLDLLRQAMTTCLAQEMAHCSVQLTHQEAACRAQLYDLGAVLSETHAENGNYLLELRLPMNKFLQVMKNNQEK